MWRAVAIAAGRAQPARSTGGGVVGDELTGGGDDYAVADYQRRACEAPAGHLHVGVGHSVARPYRCAITSVERIYNAGCAKSVHAAAVKGGCRTRARTRIRFPESRCVAVCPHRFAGSRVVTGDQLVVATLLLRIEKVTADRKGPPARSD